MDQKPEHDSPRKPNVPPPDLSRKPLPPPPSPLDGIDKPTAPPAPLHVPPAGDAAVKLKIRTAGEVEEPSVSGLASFNSRVVAVVIDMVVALGIVIGLAWILPDFAGRLAYFTGIAYLLTRDSLPFLGGQSVGKKAMKLRAVTMDGAPLAGNWQAGLIRNGVLLIPLFPLVELFILLSREDQPARGQRLGDEWAKTRVVVEEEPPVEDESHQ